MLCVFYQLICAAHTRALIPPFFALGHDPDVSSKARHWHPCNGSTEPCAVPSFFVIGQQKCGTTSLFRYLSQNPWIHTPKQKEYFFWTAKPRRLQQCQFPITDYLRIVHGAWQKVAPIVAKAANVTGIGTRKIVGDFTAAHMSCSCCLENLYRVNSSARVIIVLRDPIQRTLSRFEEQRRLKTRFSHSMNGSLNIWGDYIIDYLDACGWDLRCLEYSNVIGFSYYGPFIRNVHRIFDKNQVLIVYSEDFHENPRETLRKIQKFAGIPDFEVSQDMLNKKYNTQSNIGWHGITTSSKQTVYRYQLSPKICAFLFAAVADMRDLASKGLVPPVPNSWGSRNCVPGVAAHPPGPPPPEKDIKRISWLLRHLNLSKPDLRFKTQMPNVVSGYGLDRIDSDSGFPRPDKMKKQSTIDVIRGTTILSWSVGFCGLMVVTVRLVTCVAAVAIDKYYA